MTLQNERITAAEVTGYLQRMREHPNPEISDWFSDKLSEEEAVDILQCQVSSLRTKRARGEWKLDVWRVGRYPIFSTQQVLSLIAPKARESKALPRRARGRA